jgi:hypothetical protein
MRNGAYVSSTTSRKSRIRKHFRAELDTGHIKANAKVAGNL